MFTRLATWAAAAPRRLAGLGLLALIVLAVFGAPAVGKLNAPQAFNDPGSQSTLAQAQIADATGHDAYPEIVALVTAPPSSAAVAHAAAVIKADPAVASITVPSPGARSPLVSRDGAQILIPAVLRTGVTQDTVVKRLTSDFASDPAVLLGGDAVSARQAGQQATRDLALAELITFPLLALLSLVIFRGVATVLPLAVGAVTVFGTFAVLRAVNLALPLSPFALNLVIGLGLGLAVDYSLLFTSRFREELGHPAATQGSALAATLNSAGRTVTFSAITVAAAMACLTVFPQRFLVSMGIGGAAVALAAAAVTLLLLPPLLHLLARRLGKVHLAVEGTGRWHALARAVMRRPGRTATCATLLMLLVAGPAAGIHWTGIDASVLPSSQSSRVVADTIASDFPGADTSPLTVAVTAPANAAPAVSAYASGLHGISGVLSVTPPADLGHDTFQISVGVRGAPASAAAQALVAKVRAQPAPFPVAVGGQAASLADARAAVARTLPVALPLLAALTLVVLWLMTGSVTLPVMALLSNALTTVTATGIVVFVFQDGHLARLLGSSGQSGIEQTNYLVLAAIVFGLSTDYGVFLLTRIKEAREAGRSAGDAIAVGIQRTGAIVSAAQPATPAVPGRVLVTGATGLLGSNVTAELLAGGTEVLALARSAERARRLLPAHERLRILEGDITRVDGFAAQLRGVDTIVHTAAWFREYYQPGGNDPAQLQRVNVDAVERLLEAAADAEVPVLVHISSATTIGTRPDGQPSDEDTPPDPGWERNGYRASKVRAELVIQGWSESDGVRIPVIVPAWMWGPGDAGPTASGRLFLAVARGELGAVPRVGSQIVDARDVAAAAVRAITAGAHGRRYIVGGGWQPLPAVTRQVAIAADGRVPREVPAAVAMGGATAMELTARLLHRDPAVTRAGTRVLLEGNTQHLVSQRAERELGVTFRPLGQTITDEADRYRAHGTLPARRRDDMSLYATKSQAK